MDVQLKHPMSMLISGGRGAGKTVFTLNLIRYAGHIFNQIPNRIVWCYAKHQPQLLEELHKINPIIEYVQGIPENLEGKFNRSQSNLIILDDLMDEASDDMRVSQLFP